MCIRDSHEEGPGQNEIDFRYSDPLTAADNAMTLQAIVKIIAERNGLCADFSPKPLEGKPGNGFHINMSVKSTDGLDHLPEMVAGVLDKVGEMTAFLNPTRESYSRLGGYKAPDYISWSKGNRSQLIRIPAAAGEYRRAELRSPDPMANPYLAFALMIYAGLYGIERHLEMPHPAEVDLYQADAETLVKFRRLPQNLQSACATAADSPFIQTYIPEAILAEYRKRA